MKGFFAFILDALRDVDVTKLAKPLYILATADEETSMAGARYFAETTALRPDCAIIGEPTSLQPYARIKVISLTPSVFRASRATPAIQHAELTLSN